MNLSKPTVLTAVWVLGACFVPLGIARAEYATIAGAPVTQGQLRIVDSAAEAESAQQGAGTDVGKAQKRPRPTDRFILKETRVEAEISGLLARVNVAQTFQNSYPERLEALYVFPLPEDAAVHAYSFLVGEQLIEGVVKTRAEARKEYEEARDDGRKAALLEEERANIFSQSLANIPPGGTVTVRIRYVHTVKIDGPRYTFRFPMVVGPRYVPGKGVQRPNVGRGWADDTDEVPDASRISPPILPPGKRNGNDVFINVRLDAGLPIQKVTAVTHAMDIQQSTPTTAAIKLQNGPTIADKDFVLEYRLAGEQPVMATIAHRSEKTADGYVAFMLQPKRQITTTEITAREVCLLLDVSGSMQGPSISQLRVMAQRLLDKLNPQDTFRVVTFDTHVRAFQRAPLEATPENVAAAQQFVRGLRAGSGTNLLPALKEVLKGRDAESGKPLYLILISDALVGNDDRVLGYMRHSSFSGVRVFPVAVGAAPNHYLIERAAEIGRGFAMHVTNQDNAASMAERFANKIAAPYITDLELDWGGLDVRDVIPSPLPDLYAAEPLVVLARYRKPGQGKVTLKGNIVGQAVATTLDLTLPEEETAHDALAPAWAKRRIRQIWNRNVGQESSKARAEITQLGLQHQLVTRYTSFVAVEKKAPNVTPPTDTLRTQQVRVLLPEGMTEKAAGPAAFQKPRQRTGRQPGQAQPAQTQPAQPAPRVTAPPRQPPPKRPAPQPRSRRGGSRGGGSVEWVFLASLGLLGAGTALGRRRQLQRGK